MEAHPAARVAGLLLVAMAFATAPSLVGAEKAPYLLLLGGTVLAASLAAGTRLWCRRCLQAGWGAVLLSALAVTGQVLASVVGGPGGPAAGWSPQAVVVVALGVSVPLLLAVAGRAALAVPEEARPYAP